MYKCRPKFLFVPIFATVAFLLICEGCGGSRTIGPHAATASLAISIDWPDRSRLIPVASNSIRVVLRRGGETIAERVMPRPVGQSQSTALFDGLSSGEVLVEAQAFPSIDGSGVALAAGAKVASVVFGKTANATLTMESSIEQVIVSPATVALSVGQETQVSVEAIDSTGRTVLLTPTKLQWSSSLISVASVSPISGTSSAVIRGIGFGGSDIKLTEAESGKIGHASVTVGATGYAVDWEYQQLDQPRGVSLDGSGNVFVAEIWNNGSGSSVNKLTSQGSLVSSFDGSSGGFPFGQAYGIVVSANGDLYVSESQSSPHRIQQFKSNFAFIRKWGSHGTGSGQFDDPRHLSIDGQGNIYVADSGNHRIQRFTSSGQFVSTFGSQGSGPGQFFEPKGVAVDKVSGFIYVADSGNNRVQKFTLGGQFVSQWGAFGTGQGQFDDPYALAVDKVGQVYVADTWNSRVQKFTPVGEFVMSFGNGIVDTPRGIAVDASGNVYVTSWFTKITKFRPQ